MNDTLGRAQELSNLLTVRPLRFDYIEQLANVVDGKTESMWNLQMEFEK